VNSISLSLYSSGQVDASLAPFRQSVQLDANAIQPRLLLAAGMHQLGQRSDAEVQWRAVLQIDPASNDALDGLSKAMIEDGDFMAAIELLRNVNRDEDLTLILASAYGQAGMLDESATTVKAGLVSAPSSLRLTNALATVYVHQHRIQDATVLLEQYLRQHPADVDAQIDYLRVLVLKNDSATARPLGRTLLAAMPHNFDVLYLNGVLEREAEEYAAARDHLREAIQLQPEDYSSRYYLGVALAHLDDSANAKQQLEKAIELDATQAEAHFQLAAVLRTLGETQTAQDQLNLYQKLKRSSAAVAEAETRAEQASQKLAAGDAAQAATLYREAVEATPDNALLNYQLAMVLEQIGDAGGERSALEQAVKVDPTFALAQNQLGYLIYRSGSLADAEEHFRLAVKSAPTFTDAWINLAATLASRTRIAEAQGAVATALRLDPKKAQALQLNDRLNAAAAPR
jgi:tetratricopeptide (TPR) repeat protein